MFIALDARLDQRATTKEGALVSRVQVTDRKGNQATPLASAIRWKCCSHKNCDMLRGDLHKVFHRLCGRERHTWNAFVLSAQAGRMPALEKLL